MHFFYVCSFLSLCFWSEAASARATYSYEERDAVFLSERNLVRRNSTTTVPDCASSCTDIYIPQYCASPTNTTCICSTSNLTATLSTCAYAACNITDLLQLQRYQAEECGIANDKAKINEVLLMDYIVPAITTLFIIGRLCARIRLDVGLGCDDWVLIAAYFAYMTAVATSLGLVLNQFGEHTFWLTTGQVVRSLKFFFYTELFYMVSVTLTKLSLLLFFLRIFPSRTLLKIAWALGIFIVLSNFCILIALAFQCVPFHGYWTNWMYKTNPVKCINQFAALNVAAGLGIFHNVAILALPLPTLWGLNLPWQRKLNLLVMFSVGSFVVFCSCLRLPSLAKLRASKDISYDQAPIIVFSHLEQGVGLITACLPACRSLLEYFLPALKMSNTSSSNGGGQRANPGARASKHGTLMRSFIELHDRMPDLDLNQMETEMSLHEVLAGAPSGTCKKGGCREMGFGHETRVAGGGRELPDSVLVPMSVGVSMGVPLLRNGERESSEIREVRLVGCNGAKKEGVIVCTKTVEFEHEKV